MFHTRIVIGIILLLFSETLFSQKIENLRIGKENNQIHIYYDLSEVDESKIVKIEVFVSEDGGNAYTIIPKSVFGDVGSGVSPGNNKKIIWDVLNDVEELVGENFKFKVTARYLTSTTRSSIYKGSYFGPTLGYGNFDKENCMTAGIRGVWFLGRIGVGFSINGFATRSEYLQWDTREFYGFYAGISTEPVLLKTSKINLYAPVFFGLGQIMEQFKDPEYQDIPRNILRSGIVEPGLGIEFIPGDKFHISLETKYLVSKKLELYDVSGSPRTINGISVNLNFKFGTFDY